MNQPLRTAMFGNLLFSSISATSFLLATRTFANSSGLPELAFKVIGFGLLGFALILWFGIQPTQNQARIGKLVVILDWAWVFSSFVVLIPGLVPLTTIGSLGVLCIALIVAGFALWQQRSLRFMGA